MTFLKNVMEYEIHNLNVKSFNEVILTVEKILSNIGHKNVLIISKEITNIGDERSFITADETEVELIYRKKSKNLNIIVTNRDGKFKSNQFVQEFYSKFKQFIDKLNVELFVCEIDDIRYIDMNFIPSEEK